MDPITCCLAGLCCPPLERRQKVAAHYRSLGADEALSFVLADDAIKRFDESPFGLLVKAMHKAHKHD